jgi:hypothetical protein
MPVTFPITITPPSAPVKTEIERLLAATRHPARDFAGLSALALANFRVAATQWGGCFRSGARVDVALVFEMPPNGEDRATGFSNGSADLGKAPHYPDCTLGMEGAAAQISGEGVPDQTGITIKLRAGNRFGLVQDRTAQVIPPALCTDSPTRHGRPRALRPGGVPAIHVFEFVCVSRRGCPAQGRA